MSRDQHSGDVDAAFAAYKRREGNCTDGSPHPTRTANLDWQLLRRAFDAGVSAQPSTATGGGLAVVLRKCRALAEGAAVQNRDILVQEIDALLAQSESRGTDDRVDDGLRSAAVDVHTDKLEPAHLQDAPRVRQQTFTVQRGGSVIEVVFAQFAACIEREANQLRAAPSATARTDAINECIRVLTDEFYRPDGDFNFARAIELVSALRSTDR